MQAGTEAAAELKLTAADVARIDLQAGDTDYASLFPGYADDQKLFSALLDCYGQASAASLVEFQYPEDVYMFNANLWFAPKSYFILKSGQEARLYAAGPDTVLLTKPGEEKLLAVADKALAAELGARMEDVFQAQRVRTKGSLLVEPEERAVPLGRSFTIKGDMERANEKVQVFLTPAGTLPKEWAGDFYASIPSGDVTYPSKETVFLGALPVKYGRYQQRITLCPRLGRRVDGTTGIITPGDWQLIVRSRNIGKTAVVYESSLTILPGSQASTISLVVNGQEVFTDVPPELKDDSLWVPVRALAEALGCQVQYEAPNERILVRPATGAVISLAARSGSDRGRFGQEIIVGRPLPVKNGRLLAPVRALSEALGFTVQWDAGNKVVWVSK